MTEPELDSYRQQLRALAARLRGEVSGLRGEAIGTTDPAGDVADLLADRGDMADHAAEENITRSVLGSEEAIQAEVTAALGRIAAGTYGRCAACGKAIAKARLRAVPYARHCVTCATAGGAAPTA